MNRRLLSWLYLGIGVTALVGMWCNIALFLLGPGGTPREFFRALVANPAVTMLTVEMGCMALASSLLMYTEARRRQMRGPWTIVLLAAAVGFGVVFPLFLAVRERRAHAEMCPGPTGRQSQTS
jgi:hypothetical protein